MDTRFIRCLSETRSFKLGQNSVDLILFDLRLHDDRELSLVNKIKEASPDTIISIMIDQNKIKTVINTLCLDTVDYMLKPLILDYLKKPSKKPFTSSNWNRALKITGRERNYQQH